MIGAFGTGKVADYTGVIEEIPIKLNKITNMGLFEGESLTTSTAIIDVDSYGIKVRGTHDRRGPAKGIEHGETKQLPVIIPHIALEDFIYPEDVEERRKPGTDEHDSLTRVRTKRLGIMSGDLDLTHEYMRLSAIKGQTKDGKGKTLFDAYTALDKTMKAETFDFDATTGLRTKLLDIKRYIEDNNKTGGLITGIGCAISSSLFNALVSNPEMEEAYGNQVGLPNPMRDDLRAGFEFQGIYFIEYSGSFALEDGTTEKAIEDKTGYFFPMGVSGMFKEFYAPANRLDYVGTAGSLKYAFEYSDQEGKHLKLEAESNALMVNLRPEMVVKLTNTAT